MSSEFEVWSSRHMKMFGMTRPEDAEMFILWNDIFTLMGYTFDELTHATNVIACAPTPLKWRDDHLAAIHLHIRNLRADKRRREANMVNDPDERGVCDLCRGAGMVEVPHPRYIVAGEWQWNGSTKPTCAVICTCGRGQRIYDSQLSRGLDKKQLRLGDYEQKFSRTLWRGWMVELAGEQSQRAATQEKTRYFDGKLGALPIGKLLTAAANGTAGDLLESAKRTRTPDGTRVDPPRTEAAKPVADDIRNKCPV